MQERLKTYALPCKGVKKLKITKDIFDNMKYIRDLKMTFIWPFDVSPAIISFQVQPNCSM